jgi:peptidoglycan hydrolase-like protein with peptidoglycan-binding domain
MRQSHSALGLLALALSPLWLPQPHALAGIECYQRRYSYNLIRAVQAWLEAEGFAPGPIDGIWGPRTREAVSHLQRRDGLNVTGDLDNPTLKRILGDAAPARGVTVVRNPGGVPEDLFAKHCGDPGLP